MHTGRVPWLVILASEEIRLIRCKNTGSLTADDESVVDKMGPVLGRFKGKNIRLFKHGIDGIITSDPLLARQVLEER